MPYNYTLTSFSWVGSILSSLPWRERVRVRGIIWLHPHLNPLPSREREGMVVPPAKGEEIRRELSW